jgi:hypothetical protein
MSRDASALRAHNGCRRSVWSLRVRRWTHPKPPAARVARTSIAWSGRLFLKKRPGLCWSPVTTEAIRRIQSWLLYELGRLYDDGKDDALVGPVQAFDAALTPESMRIR